MKMDMTSPRERERERERKTKSLGKLLLDEKGAQMRELPYASYGENNELDQRPANDARVCVFGLIAEFGFTLLL